MVDDPPDVPLTPSPIQDLPPNIFEEELKDRENLLRAMIVIDEAHARPILKTLYYDNNLRAFYEKKIKASENLEKITQDKEKAFGFSPDVKTMGPEEKKKYYALMQKYNKLNTEAKQSYHTYDTALEAKIKYFCDKEKISSGISPGEKEKREELENALSYMYRYLKNEERKGEGYEESIQKALPPGKVADLPLQIDELKAHFDAAVPAGISTLNHPDIAAMLAEGQKYDPAPGSGKNAAIVAPGRKPGTEIT